MIQRACSLTLAEVAASTRGAVHGPGALALAGVSTDSRDALTDQLFVALAGEKFDAHDFLAEARAKGAAALLVSREGLARARARGFDSSSTPHVVVEDTLTALGDLGAFHRRRLGTLVFALTGSNGKTTTKEMIAAILGRSRKVRKTEGNLNNLIGVPMTLLGLSSSDDVAVVEMGMNRKGEIARYAEIAAPEIGLVLNVAPAHIGMLGSLAAIGDAKGELFFGLDRARGLAVVNADDPEVRRVAEASGVQHARTFGCNPDADVVLVDYTPEPGARGGRARYRVDGAPLEVEIPIAGEHNALNAAAAIAVATADLPHFTPASRADCAAGIGSAAYVARRMVFEEVGPFVVVDDCYNANSASMKAAIETVAAYAARSGGRFVALLGEIRELGSFAAEEHRRVGEAVARARPAVVAAFGTEASPIAEVAARAGLEAHHEASNVDDLFAWLRPRLQPGDVILVKGSRGMAMERFIERIRTEAS